MLGIAGYAQRAYVVAPAGVVALARGDDWLIYSVHEDRETLATRGNEVSGARLMLFCAALHGVGTEIARYKAGKTA